MAFNLPVEAERGPFVGSALIDVLTCSPDERPDEVLARLGPDGGDRVVVVNEGRVVLGTLAVDKLRTLGHDVSVSDALEPSPATIRPSVELSKLDDKVAGVLVTTPDGVLLGAVDPSAIVVEDEPVED